MTHRNREVAVLQLCAGTSCLILQLLHASHIPASVRDLLGDPTVRLVGIGVGEDAARLEIDHSLKCTAPVDLEDVCNRHLGILYGERRLGLKGYAKEVLGLVMEKPMHVTTSDWEKRELDGAQVHYACVDAYVSYKLGERVLPN